MRWSLVHISESAPRRRHPPARHSPLGTRNPTRPSFSKQPLDPLKRASRPGGPVAGSDAGLILPTPPPSPPKPPPPPLVLPGVEGRNTRSTTDFNIGSFGPLEDKRGLENHIPSLSSREDLMMAQHQREGEERPYTTRDKGMLFCKHDLIRLIS
ncbi:hypothetical protein E2C01_040013 [Portunus trituberculatus]|uniref:Uncharacterized protein n=1 Tax=Portunus trituberculatus TaxID=210409 RepID=A0A5B7FLB4_PORTR|nr:hypothetical protein [Portunus trituberculatus]